MLANRPKSPHLRLKDHTNKPGQASKRSAREMVTPRMVHRIWRLVAIASLTLAVGSDARSSGGSGLHAQHRTRVGRNHLLHSDPPRGGGLGGGGGGSAGLNRGTRRAPTTLPPAQDSYQSQQQSSAMAPPQKYQQEQLDAKEALNSFLTRDSRNTFIARVYGILAVQLLLTAGSVVAFGLHPDITISLLRRFGMGVPLLSLGLSTIAWIVMCMSVTARRASPIKWQLLSLFTIGEALSVGIISSFYRFPSVVSAMLATAVATVTVSVYTVKQKNPKYDLSQWGATLSSFGVMFLVYGLVALLMQTGVLPPNLLPYTDMLYCLLGATLFSFYLAYHTKLIVAGKHAKYQMNEKDYVFGAMTLYNDIINIFIYILRLMGDERTSDRR